MIIRLLSVKDICLDICFCEFLIVHKLYVYVLTIVYSHIIYCLDSQFGDVNPLFTFKMQPRPEQNFSANIVQTLLQLVDLKFKKKFHDTCRGTWRVLVRVKKNLIKMASATKPILKTEICK